ncbi:MAG: serine/threonine-protein kinase [Solirubrobacteraceae bacterium]
MDDYHQTTSDPEPGARRTAPRMVGRYEILDEIGRGGMGVVYKARQPELDRMVALKRLHSIHEGAPAIVERFVREAKLVGSLNHRNIVTVYDYIEEDGASYIAMEYIPRGSLRPWVGGLSLAQLAGVLEGLLAGLAVVEPEGIVHRDLKPENVMVTGDGLVKITDFGIAKTTQNAGVTSFMTTTGATVGTPAYMAPEQALSQEVGPWTDLYSVGIMAYEQLVGRVPFHDSETPVAILLRRVNEPIPPVLADRPDLDPSLSEWISRLLVKEPAARTSSASQAWEELEEIVLELLGPRWRRAAGLPADPRDLQPKGTSKPKPELESGFLAFGSSPTDMQQPGPRADKPGGEDRSASEPRAHRDASHSVGTPAPPQPLGPTGPEPIASHMQQVTPARRPARKVAPGRAQAQTDRGFPSPRRRLLLAALIMALAAAVGFVLAPIGASDKPPVHNGSVARTAQPTRAYALALDNALTKLNDTRERESAKLAHATTASAQAEAAQRLARAHSQAAAAVRNASPGVLERNENAAIVAALSRIAGGYAATASAAHRENHSDFESARNVVRKGTLSLEAALERLRQLGYRLST